MNIVFLCGSLEPGRDGVGDYVRRLAVALQQQGHIVSGVALNDQHITDYDEVTQPTEAGYLVAVRLPAIWPVAKRFAYARRWLNDFRPDWLSLQFVPFSFHSKGLIFKLAEQLRELNCGQQWHLMIHELWVGMDQESSRKHIWWGWLQRYLIKRLITILKPKVIHTQTQLYQQQLAKLGFTSHYLPLFANIPNSVATTTTVGTTASSQPLARTLAAEKELSLVVFGTIHPHSLIKQLADDVAGYSQQHETAVTLKFVGRCGSAQEQWAAIWQAVGLSVEILGEQSPARVSEILLTASIGIATTPALLLGKSGTVAAMHEHGLPVLCIAGPWHPRGIFDLSLPAGTVEYRTGSFEACLQQMTMPSINKVYDIAHQLSETLLAAS